MKALEAQAAKVTDAQLRSIVRWNLDAIKALLNAKDPQRAIFLYVLLMQSLSGTEMIQVAWAQSGAPSVTGVKLVPGKPLQGLKDVYLDATAYDYAGNIKDSERDVVFGVRIKIDQVLANQLRGVGEGGAIVLHLLAGQRTVASGNLIVEFTKDGQSGDGSQPPPK